MKEFQFLPFSFIRTFRILFPFLFFSFMELQECTDHKIWNCTSSFQGSRAYRMANCCRLFGQDFRLECNRIPIDTASRTGGVEYWGGYLRVVKHLVKFYHCPEVPEGLHVSRDRLWLLLLFLSAYILLRRHRFLVAQLIYFVLVLCSVLFLGDLRSKKTVKN